MTLDLAPIRAALAERAQVARVVLTSIRGSTPREAGTAMLVWRDGQAGTIGGGALEWEATATARDALARGLGRVTQHALGPELGQCCGGAVVLATEIWDAGLLARAEAGGPVFSRRIAGDLPCPAAPIHASGRPFLEAGWLAEPIAPPGLPLWIWGAGHVGRAVIHAMHPLPDWQITWADIGPDRFPEQMPGHVTRLWAQDLPRLADHAPPDACHLILTHSHAIDLALCDRLIRRGFTFCGLIGSATKQARFAKRLGALGHAPDAAARITCPIGARDLGKHPAQLAIGVAAQLLGVHSAARAATPATASSRTGP